MATKSRDRSAAGAPVAPRTRSGGRPVLLGTLSVRVDPTAERMAIDSALETGAPLIIANVTRLPPYPTTMVLVGPSAAVLPHEEDLDAVRETANRAAALGLKVEHLRVATKRPVDALLQVVRERDPGLLVFGPDLTLIKPRRLRRAAKRIRREADCLVWIAGED
jgi:nucleotide-binding universal stress UspA family protein